MPTLPSRQQQAIGTPQLRPGSFTQFQDQSGRQLQQAGRALEFAGGGLARLGDSIKAQHDTARIKEGIGQFRSYEQGMLSPAEGFRAKRGKDAMDAYEPSLEQLRARRDSIAAGLQNAEQREAFKAATERDLMQAQATMETHLARESTRYNLAQTEGLINSSVTVYRESQDDPRAAAVALGQVRENVAEFAELAGFAPEQTKALLTQEMTKAHAGVVEDLLSEGDPRAAADYLSTNRGAMDRGTARQLSDRVKSKRTAVDAQDLAFTLTDKHGDAPTLLDLEVAAMGELEERFRAPGSGMSVELFLSARASIGRTVSDMQRRQAAEDGQWITQFREAVSSGDVRALDQLPDEMQAYAQARPEVADQANKWFAGKVDAETDRAYRAARLFSREDFLSLYADEGTFIQQFGMLPDTKWDRIQGLRDRYMGNGQTKNAKLARRSDLAEKRLAPHLWAYRTYDDEGNAITSERDRRKAGLDPDVLQRIEDKIDEETRNRGVESMSDADVAKFLDDEFKDAEYKSEAGAPVPRFLRDVIPNVDERRAATRTTALGQITSARAQAIHNVRKNPALFNFYNDQLGDTASDATREDLDIRLGQPSTVAEARQRVDLITRGLMQPGGELGTKLQMIRLLDDETRSAYAWLERSYGRSSPGVLPGNLDDAVSDFKLNEKQERALRRVFESERLNNPHMGQTRGTAGPSRSPYPTGGSR